MDRREFLNSATLVAAAAASVAVNTSTASADSSEVTVGPIKIAQATPLKALTIGADAEMLESVASLKHPATNHEETKSEPPAKELPEILQPIDAGAIDLLTPFKNSRLRYSPMEVEYLANTLDDHISNCLSLREKAQQLEVLAVAHRLELMMEQKTVEYLTEMAELESENSSRVSATRGRPNLS